MAAAIQTGLQRFAKPWNRRRALAVFRDEASLAATASLAGSVRRALDESRYLILVASPAAVQSRWVDQELRHWLATRSVDTILPVVACGEWAWDDEHRRFADTDDCAVPPTLRDAYHDEPRFVDVRQFEPPSLTLRHLGFRNAIADLAAPVHGLPKDELHGEELRLYRRARTLRAAAVGGLCLLAVAVLMVGLVAKVQAERAASAMNDATTSRRVSAQEQRRAQEARTEAQRQATLADQQKAAAHDARQEADRQRQEAATHEAAAEVAAARAREQEQAAATAGDRAATARAEANWQRAIAAQERQQAEAASTRADRAATRAQEQARMAEQNAREAAANRAASQVWPMLAEHPDQAQLVARYALDIAPTQPVTDAVIGALARPMYTAVPLHGHTRGVTSVAFSPNGATLATGSSDQTVRLWNVRTGREAGRLSADAGVTSVAFHPKDNNVLAVGSDDGTVRVWDLAAGRSVRLHVDGGVTSVAFSPGGGTVAVGTLDTRVWLWEFSTGNTTALEHSSLVVSVAFSPDGTTLATGGYDGTVRLWALAKRTYTDLHGRPSCGALAYNHDGKILATGCYDVVTLWNPATRGQIRTLPATDALSLAFDPAGATLAIGTGTNIRLWDPATGTKTDLSGHVDFVTSVAYSRNGTLASGALDGVARLWSRTAETANRALPGLVNSLTFNPKSRTIAAGVGTYQLRLWNLDTGTATYLDGHSGVVLSVAYNPAGTILASSSLDGTVRLWDPSSGKGRILGTPSGYVTSVAFDPKDSNILATGSADGSVRLWNVAAGTSVLIGRVSPVDAAAFSPDGTILATGSSDGTARLWSLATQTVTTTLTGHAEAVWSVAFSPDGKTVATGSEDATVRLSSVATGNTNAIFHDHAHAVSSVAYSPDGTTVISGSRDGTVRLRNMITGATITIPEPTGKYDVSSVAVSADGTTLAIGSDSSTAVLATPWSWGDELCRRAGRNLTRSEWSEYAPATEYRRLCPSFPELVPEDRVLASVFR